MPIFRDSKDRERIFEVPGRLCVLGIQAGHRQSVLMTFWPPSHLLRSYSLMDSGYPTPWISRRPLWSRLILGSACAEGECA